MPRQPRTDAPGVAHHVVIRGIERRRIFLDDQDRDAFERRLDRFIPEFGFVCFGWVLMPNHVHLVLQTGPTPLSRLMAGLGTSYAGHFNRRHDRAGHLFQNRFWSRPIEDEAALLASILYVHRNPLRAGFVADEAALARLEGCGHGALVGARAARPFEAVAATHALVDPDPARAIRVYRARIADAAVDLLAPLPAPTSPVVGCATPQRASTRPEAGLRPTLSELIADACAKTACPASLVGTKRRAAVEARARIAAAAILEWGYAVREVADALGVANSSVSRALDRRHRDG